MSQETLLIARYRGDVLDFTKPATLPELFKAVNERLPVDKIYALVPSNGGFTMVEVGQLVLQLQPIGQDVDPIAEPILTPVIAPQQPPPVTPPLQTKAKKKTAHKSNKAPVTKDSPPELTAHRGKVEVTGFTPGSDYASDQVDPNSHLSGPFWKE